MVVTMRQFEEEVGPLLKSLYIQHRTSRADYKEATQVLALKKMPRATEEDRRKFTEFALSVYDVMRRIGFSPDTSVVEMGRELAKIVN